MNDRISLHFPLSLKLGITAKERAKVQKVQCHIWYYVDAAKIARTDEVSDSSDYALIVCAVQEGIKKNDYKTIERLAEDVATIVLRQTKVGLVTVNIEKQPKDFPGLYASITIDRPSKQ